jgi:hypothetical protein
MRPNDLRFCCRGVRRSRATQQENILRAAAPRLRHGQQQARVRRPSGAPHRGMGSVAPEDHVFDDVVQHLVPIHVEDLRFQRVPRHGTTTSAEADEHVPIRCMKN